MYSFIRDCRTVQLLRGAHSATRDSFLWLENILKNRFSKIKRSRAAITTLYLFQLLTCLYLLHSVQLVQCMCPKSTKITWLESWPHFQIPISKHSVCVIGSLHKCQISGNFWIWIDSFVWLALYTSVKFQQSFAHPPLPLCKKYLDTKILLVHVHTFRVASGLATKPNRGPPGLPAHLCRTHFTV